MIRDGTLQAGKYRNQYLVKVVDADALTIHDKPGRPKKNITEAKETVKKS